MNTPDINQGTAEKFIADANGIVEVKIKKVPIALRFNSDLLANIDALAKRRSMSRNSLISHWCAKGIEDNV